MTSISILMQFSYGETLAPLGLPTAGGGIPRHPAGRRRRRQLLRSRDGVGCHGREDGRGDGQTQAALGHENPMATRNGNPIMGMYNGMISHD